MLVEISAKKIDKLHLSSQDKLTLNDSDSRWLFRVNLSIKVNCDLSRVFW